jgi:hypothetical protein
MSIKIEVVRQGDLYAVRRTTAAGNYEYRSLTEEYWWSRGHIGQCLGSYDEVKHLYFVIKSDINSPKEETVIEMTEDHREQKPENDMPRIPIAVLSAAFYAAREKKSQRTVTFPEFDDWYRYYEDSQLPPLPSKADRSVREQ